MFNKQHLVLFVFYIDAYEDKLMLCKALVNSERFESDSWLARLPAWAESGRRHLSSSCKTV